MRLADRIIAWIVVLLGAIYVSAIHHQFAAEVMWYLGSGLFVILVGALNLIRIRYSHAAPGLRWFLVLVDLVLAGFAFFLGRASGLAVPGAIVAALAVIEAIFSFMPGEQPI
jgi:hypothetical protein